MFLAPEVSGSATDKMRDYILLKNNWHKTYECVCYLTVSGDFKCQFKVSFSKVILVRFSKEATTEAVITKYGNFFRYKIFSFTFKRSFTVLLFFSDWLLASD